MKSKMNAIRALLCIFILQLLLSITMMNKANAQLIVTEASDLPGWDADAFIRNILLDDGVSVSNAMFNGSSSIIDCNSIGKFETGDNPTNLGMASGLIIASGGVSVAVGPNNIASAHELTTCDAYYDDDLSSIASNTTNDVAVLEFDFVPWSDTLSFKFVFGSEEYPEYVGSQYNDVFGFFLSGINPQGGMYDNQNMALIPGTNDVVSINNLNANHNGSYYIDNTSGTTIQFDGFTTPLEVRFAVVPMTTYHIKMAICDVADIKYDSGVFLEAQSFTTNLEYGMSIDNILHSNIPDDYYFCADHVMEFKTVTEWHYDEAIWYFGDGTSSIGTDATHVYENEGFYNVMNVLHNPYRDTDSIYLYKTIEIRKPHSESVATICDGESLLWNGHEYSHAGIYVDTLDSHYDCDSIVTLYLNVVGNMEIHGLTEIAVSSDVWPGIYNYCLADSANLQQCDITWSCSNPNWILLLSDNPYWCTIIATTVGSATLTAMGSCDSFCDTGFTIEINATYLDIEETDDNPISVYPNPASNQIIIRGVQLKQIMIYDCYGQIVYNSSVDMSDEVSVGTEDMDNGLYVADIVTAKGKTTKRLCVLK